LQLRTQHTNSNKQKNTRLVTETLQVNVFNNTSKACKRTKINAFNAVVEIPLIQLFKLK